MTKWQTFAGGRNFVDKYFKTEKINHTDMSKDKVKEQETAKNTKEEVKDTAKAEKKDKKAEAAQKELETVKNELEETKAKLETEKNDYLKLMAEFETFRRRNAEERLALIANASADTIKGLLPVLDDCERALQILASSSDDAAKEGTELIYSKLMAYLKTKGLEVIDAKGKDFDVDFHEAVTQFPAPDESMKGKVIDVVQTGYLLNGKVIRYAKVVVGA